MLLTAAPAGWADHAAGDLRAPANPWWEALLWGMLGFLVAITVTLVVMLFTRSPAKPERGKRTRW